MIIDIAAMLAEFHGAVDQPFGCGSLDDPFFVDLRRDLNAEEAKETDDALVDGDPAAILKELADIVYVAYGTAHMLGLPLDAAIDIVHRANMTKVAGPVTWRPDGKVLKGADYRPPDPAALLAAIFEQRADQ